MAARFKTIAADGREVVLNDVQAVVEALRDGILGPESMLFDSHQNRWLRADKHDATQAAIAALGDQRMSPLPPTGSAVVAPSPSGEAGSRTGVDHRLDADAMLDRLRAYVGRNWESHYQKSFPRLLAARRGNTTSGWTWNWPAALFPVWFLYRRLYLAFFGFVALYILIDLVDKAAAGSFERGSPFVFLFLGQIVWMGFVGDRLLFRKAYRIVKDPAAPENPRPARDPVSTKHPGQLKCVRCSQVYPSRYYFTDEGRSGLICTQCAGGTF